MINLVEKLIPKKGFAWRLFNEHIKLLIEALSEEPKRIKAFLETVARESNPDAAIDTQEDWYQQYSLLYNDTKSTVDKQAETLERYIAVGDQDIVYLQNQLDSAGFDEITLFETGPPTDDATNVCGPAECGPAECWSLPDYITDVDNWIFYYLVTGTIDVDSDFDRLVNLLQRLAPGHLIPVFNVSVSDNVCGPAECGSAFCDG